ncbi:CHASE2 domain-containing protein [Limnohabitans sp. 2KL-3]|uniref:CHASE2 domain-containing protein n=1 Tax=Limnohabitans sp. 2KL-3 TaxID=1100700 RepID=UPI000ADB7472|nr:adenylate/guanylate cyclase domain-containing protein [Limnohabitans sp. 2KL-3]
MARHTTPSATTSAAPSGSTMASLAARLLLSPFWMRSAAVALALALLALLHSQAGAWLGHWNDRLSSQTWALADSQALERRVVVVDIDEKSVQQLGAWPWPRDRVAQLLTALDAQGVNLKVVDILFDGPQGQDPVLAKALQQGAPSVMAQLFSLQAEPLVRTGQLSGALPASDLLGQACPNQTTAAFGHLSPSGTLLQSGQALGHITPVIAPDGSVRQVPALVCYQGQTYPALVVSALAAATGTHPQLTTRTELWGQRSVLDIGGFELPLNPKGQLTVSYQVPRAGFLSVSAVDVIQGTVPPGLLQGAWALVGSTAMGAGDAVPTPQGGAVGGIEVHAQLMAAALDARTPYTPTWAKLWPWLGGLFSLVILFAALYTGRMAAAVTLPLAALLSVGTLFAVHAYALLVHAQLLPWGTPAIFAVLSALLVLSADTLRVRLERERLFVNLASYLPAQAAQKVAFQEPTAQVQAQRQDATVMIIDVRNFSTYCEGRTPEDTATVLHNFYTTVERIVTQHGGVVEQMVGDSIMAVWNGSSPCPEHARQALGSAEQVWREALAQLPRVATRLTPPLDIGIGIETGPVMVGSFGPAHRRVHAVLGEPVTIAARLESLTAELAYPILLGPEVVRCAANPKPEPLGEFLLDGLTTSHQIYRLPVHYEASHLHLVYSIDEEKANWA